jgi:lysozyme family protein
MESDWDKAITFVLKMEGGYTLDPNDPGGETQFGISKKSYPNLDIKNLTIEHAREIYHRDFWAPCRCADLPAPLAIAVFDTAVNQGVTVAKRLLQIALDVTVDGIIGPKTLAAAAKADPWRVKKFLAERLAAYIRLMDERPNLRRYAVNWTHRLLSLHELVIPMEKAAA